MKTAQKQMYVLVLVMALQFSGCLGNSRPSSYPFIAGDTFRAIADHIIDETNQPFSPETVHDGDIIFLKTDLIPDFFERLHPQITTNYILLTHNGDHSPIFWASIECPPGKYNFIHYLEDPHIIVWFAQNADLKHPKLRPLPLGIANRYWEHGTIETFQRALSSPISWEDKLPRVYINFSLATNRQERLNALNYCKQQSFCDIAPRTKHTQYLDTIKRYRYVLSPAGNGVDCHRTWEALLVGSIPIMKHSLLDSLFEDLPVIFVDDWSEVTEDFLAKKYRTICSSQYNYATMYADYWIQEIKSYQTSGSLN